MSELNRHELLVKGTGAAATEVAAYVLVGPGLEGPPMGEANPAELARCLVRVDVGAVI